MSCDASAQGCSEALAERVLRDEPGVEPDPETLTCLHSVATGPVQPAAQAGSLPSGLVRPPRLVGRTAERTARQRLCDLVQGLGDAEEATRQRLALTRWQQQVLQPAVQALRQPG